MKKMVIDPYVLAKAFSSADSEYEGFIQDTIKVIKDAKQLRGGIQVFLSYARPDQEKAKSIYVELVNAGFSPWMDKMSIFPGDEWEKRLEIEVGNCHFFVVCLSKHTVERRPVMIKERKIALKRYDEYMERGDIFIIPLLLEELEDTEVPEDLRRFQWDYWFEDKEEGIKKLVSTIDNGIEQRRIGSSEGKRQIPFYICIDEHDNVRKRYDKDVGVSPLYQNWYKDMVENGIISGSHRGIIPDPNHNQIIGETDCFEPDQKICIGIASEVGSDCDWIYEGNEWLCAAGHNLHACPGLRYVQRQMRIPVVYVETTRARW
jgi:hypothetical protein